MWYEKIQFLFKNKELRNKFLFVIFLFVVFRIAANIPIPGFSRQDLANVFNQFSGGDNQALGLMNLFTGGALSNFSVVLMGLGPYITATIILQLLTMIFPVLEKLYKEEGESGRQKFNQYSRLLTIPLAAFEGYGMLTVFAKQGIISGLTLPVMISAILTITAGAMFLMWIGEIISEQGMGNGISLLIFAGIVAGMPMSIYQNFSGPASSLIANIPSYLAFAALSMIIIAGVVLITEARRNIPVSYAKRVRGMKMYGGTSTYLPLSVNPAGVIPIIFALSILLFPGMIAGYFGTYSGLVGSIATNIGTFFSKVWIHGVLYFLLVILFTYFYTAVTFDPKTIADNLQKMGGFVPGVRPGKSTADFMKHILNRVLFTGAMFLGLIAILPSIVEGLIPNVIGFTFLIGGTSLLIVVSVVLDTVRQINAQLQMREYETF